MQLLDHHLDQILTDAGIFGPDNSNLIRQEKSLTRYLEREYTGYLEKPVTLESTHGISFSIDEFAVSSISFFKLENFQAFSVKIHHKSLSNLIPSDKSAMQKLFRSIEALSHDFNHLLIVHEIESKEQERMFRNYKYDFAQGDYYSKPIPDVKFAQLFDRLPLCRLVI